jgi:hypothetical protein
MREALESLAKVLTVYADEDLCLSDAARVYYGQLPFRDFFQVVGWSTFCWVTPFFKLFGETWLATRLSVLPVTAATALLLYFLARRLKPGSEILPVIFWFAIAFPGWATVSTSSLPICSRSLLSRLFVVARRRASPHFVPLRDLGGRYIDHPDAEERNGVQNDASVRPGASRLPPLLLAPSDLRRRARALAPLLRRHILRATKTTFFADLHRVDQATLAGFSHARKFMPSS